MGGSGDKQFAHTGGRGDKKICIEGGQTFYVGGGGAYDNNIVEEMDVS